MKNLIENIKNGTMMEINGRKYGGFDLAKKLAEMNQAETGNKTVVNRVLDYVDQYNGRDREHYSFDITEIIPEK